AEGVPIGLIVRDRRDTAEFIDLREERVYDIFQRLGSVLFQIARHARPREFLITGIELILDPIGIEQERVPALNFVLDLFVLAVLQQTDGNAFRMRLENLTVPAQQHRARARVAEDETILTRAPRSDRQRGVERLHSAFHQTL